MSTCTLENFEIQKVQILCYLQPIHGLNSLNFKTKDRMANCNNSQKVWWEL